MCSSCPDGYSHQCSTCTLVAFSGQFDHVKWSGLLGHQWSVCTCTAVQIGHQWSVSTCELKHCWSQGYQWSTCTYVFHCQNRLVDYYYYWSLSYSAVLRCWADSLRSHVILHEWIAFYGAFFEYPPKWCTTALAWLVPQETAAISVRSVYTIQPCTMALHAKPYT